MSLDRDSFRNAEEAARSLGRSGQIVPEVVFAGVRVDTLVELNRAEHIRRKSHELGAVVDRNLWEALLDMPIGQPVPLKALDPIKKALLDGSDPGIARFSSTHVIRELDAPLRPLAVFKKCRDWGTGLEAVSRFSGVVSLRAVMLEIKPGAAALDEMESLGVGVILLRENRAQLLVAPAPTLPLFGSFYFRFLEVTYGRWAEYRRSELVPRR